MIRDCWGVWFRGENFRGGAGYDRRYMKSAEIQSYIIIVLLSVFF